MSDWSFSPNPMETNSLLDISAVIQQVNFPSLQPLRATRQKSSTSLNPVIRQGSPIDFGPEHDVVSKPVPDTPKKPTTPETPVAPTTSVKRGPSPPQPPKKANVVASKSKPATPKKSPRGKAPNTPVKNGLGQIQLKKTPNRYSPPKNPAGPPVKQANRPQWTLKTASVFSSREEERAAVRNIREIFDPNGLRDNSFFQWGLRYMPSPLTASDNAYRTVTIDHLPPQVTLDQILPRIRGGAIYSATLLDTKSITQGVTALVSFVHQEGAVAFLQRVAQEGFFIGFRPAKVHPVPTPTYVMSADMERQIFRLGRTRCVVVSSPRARLKRFLHTMLFKSPCSRHVECFGLKDPPGTVTVQFFSIKMARLAFDLLTEHPSFDDCTLQFGVDPCA